MYPPLCGSGWTLSILVLARGVPIPQADKQGWRDSGVSTAVWEWLGPVHTSFSHGASLSPKRPRHDRGDSVESAAVLEWLDDSHPIGLSHLREGIRLGVGAVSLLGVC